MLVAGAVIDTKSTTLGLREPVVPTAPALLPPAVVIGCLVGQRAVTAVSPA